jgi:hypothetical protein
MSAATLSGLAGVRRKADADAVEDARDSLVATLAWMTATAVGAPIPLPTSSPEKPAAESWRSPAGAMTPANPSSREASRSDNRIVAEVETQALGVIRLVVQRTQSGLSVVVGLRQAAAPSLTEAQRAALEQALLAAGLAVSSVSFVRLNEDGTAFALHDQGSSETPVGESTHMAANEGTRARTSGKRKINTLG